MPTAWPERPCMVRRETLRHDGIPFCRLKHMDALFSCLGTKPRKDIGKMSDKHLPRNQGALTMTRIGILALLLSGCGSVDAVQNSDGAVSADADVSEALADLPSDSLSSGDSDGHPAERNPTDADVRGEGGATCVWDPYPHAIVPCDDGVRAVCCYTRQDGSCDGRKDGCIEGGRECVLTCL